MLCECVVLPLTFCLHMLPHCLGLVVWTSVHSPLMQISLLPVWLSEGGVSTHRLYYVSHIVSDIGGSLCLSLLHYIAVLSSHKCEIFLHWYLFQSPRILFFLFWLLAFLWVIVTTCSYNSICTIFVQGVMQNFPLFEPVLRQWLQSAYIHQPLEGCPQLSHRDLSM